MKKKILFIIFSIVVFAFLVYIITAIVLMLKPSKKTIGYQEYVEEKSKIENFLNEKTESKIIIVGRIKKQAKEDLDYNYHLDENDELYLSLKTMEFEEISYENVELSSIYEIRFVYKNNIKAGTYDYRYSFKIMSNNLIEIFVEKNSKFYSASKSRIYRMKDDEYNNIIEKIEYIVENNEIYY